MTRAQQTVSLALLVSSVLLATRSALSARSRASLIIFYLQVYLAFFLQLVPVNAKIQDEILPVVRLSALESAYLEISWADILAACSFLSGLWFHSALIFSASSVGGC